LFSAAVRENDDLVGCKVIRKQTFAKYLDAENFTGGVNPTADPNQHFPDDIWFIEQKLSENKYIVEWELASVFDLQGVMLPHRQIIQDSCPWKYRGAECGYTGTSYFDLNDQPTTQSNDFCAKHLSSCKLRFGNQPLPFGGFPGAVRFSE
jgi:lambda family phage minor tail protein L